MLAVPVLCCCWHCGLDFNSNDNSSRTSSITTTHKDFTNLAWIRHTTIDRFDMQGGLKAPDYTLLKWRCASKVQPPARSIGSFFRPSSHLCRVQCTASITGLSIWVACLVKSCLSTNFAVPLAGIHRKRNQIGNPICNTRTSLQFTQQAGIRSSSLHSSTIFLAAVKHVPLQSH